MKPTIMKKVIYVLIVSLLVVSGIVFANRQTRTETSKKPEPRTLSAAEKKAEMEKWEATPGGIIYKKWKESPEGMKVLASAAKLSKQTKDFTDMEAVITSLSLPPGSRLGFGLMARIDGEDYILSFGVEEGNEFKLLRSLQVNDKIIIKSHSVSHAPKYTYAIVSGDYVEKDKKRLYKRIPRKGGC